MYVNEIECVMCGSKTTYGVSNSYKDGNFSDYKIIEKLDNNKFKCRIDVRCQECGIKFEKDEVVEFDTESFKRNHN